MTSEDFSLPSPAEMHALFPDHREAIENTQKIVDACTFELELGKITLPHFEVPSGKTPDTYLRELCEVGIPERYKAQDAKSEEGIRRRLEYELSVIIKTGFASYFLIVQDFVNWAKRQKIVVGPGRGSAAGSIVSYLLNITNLDPLKYDLVFERFLNPERISMPDIDLDFADTRRDEVLRYVEKKYGRDHVAQIITFGTMAARAAIRDVGRVLGLSYTFCDRIAKLIPMRMKLAETITNVPEIAELYNNDNDARALLDAAKKLEGVARHASTHACGVVITKEPLVEYVPVQRASSSDDTLISQYSLLPIEALGLLKMDFLGLRNLTIIEACRDIVEKTQGIHIDIDALPLDDKKTFRLLQQGATTGVFQLESSGMRRYLKQLKPTHIEDIIAMVALYRPGPMELIPDYIDGKHGKKKAQYLHPTLKPILEKTYGVAVYQEQVLQIARDLAGFTMGEADILRKAVGKKIKSLLAEQKKKFVDGCITHGVDRTTATHVFEFIEPFAGYGFNRCVTGDAQIMDARTGALHRIQDLARQNETCKKTFSLSDDLLLKKQSILRVFENGRKDVWRLRTRSGRTICATANHPFRIFSGWASLETLSVGDRIALPRRLPMPTHPISQEKHKLIILGYLLAEGNLCHPHGFYFYSKDEFELRDYCTALEQCTNTIATIDRSKSAASVYSRRKNLRSPSEAVTWIRSLGLYGKKATEKFFPSFVFQLPHDDLALLLGKLFQGDGCVNNTREYPNIFYATSSLRLARELQHLFLRLGIFSTLHKKKFRYRGGVKYGYTLSVSRYEQIRRFAETIGKNFVGKKAETMRSIIQDHAILNGTLAPWAARGSKDCIPVEVSSMVRMAVQERGESFAGCARRIGVSGRLFLADRRKQGYLRETIEVIGRALHHTALTQLATSDVYWDEIVEIRHIGKKETFDLTIDDTHNYIANDIIVHNSHAACYAFIAYQTAYLKTRYPTEFMAALLTAEYGDIERVAALVQECRAMGITVLPPDVNESFSTFTVLKDAPTPTIRFGLIAVKNLGTNIVRAIIHERKAQGAYADLFGFLERVQDKDLNRKSLESLIRSGALDRFGERNTLLANLDTLLTYHRRAGAHAENGQESLFAGTAAAGEKLTLRDAPPLPKMQLLTWERELLGLYITAHPLDEFRAHIPRDAYRIDAILQGESGKKVVAIAGVVARMRRITTRTGDPMLFLTLEDQTGTVECVVFPRVYTSAESLFRPDIPLLVYGKLSERDGEKKIIVESVRVLQENALPEDEEKIFEIHLRDEQHAALPQLRTILEQHPGKIRVVFITKQGGKERRARTSMYVDASATLRKKTQALLEV